MARFRPSLTCLDDRIVPATLPTGFTESVVATGLTQPTAMAVSPDGRIYVTEQTGSLRVIQSGTLQTTPVLSLTVDSSGERGLLGITLDPNFERNGFLYLYYTVPANGNIPTYNRVSRFTVSGTTAGSEAVLLNLDGLSSATNHNGGALHFGNDGKLYVAVGDNNSGANSQSLETRLGKVLRINPSGTIPDDNPTSFAGVSGTTSGLNRAIWAVGFRNPYNFAVQSTSGKILINDVGQTSFEEVNEGRAGANYGWPATEGRFNQTQFPDFTEPVYAYAHGSGSPDVGFAITGATFYNPLTMSYPPEYAGQYFFGDFAGQWINRLDPATGKVTNFATNLGGTQPVDLAVDTQGTLLYIARNGGATGAGGLYQIRYAVGKPIVAVGAGAGGGPAVTIFDAASGQLLNRFLAFDASFSGGVRVATGDVTGDRVPDIIVGAGPGGGPRVRVFDGLSLQPVRDIFVFESTFTGGVLVASADFDRDGYDDLIITPDNGGGPRIRIISGKTGQTISDFFAFETTFTGGARAAGGDINADGVPDLLVAAGTGGAPRIATFDGRDVVAGKSDPRRLGSDYFAFESSLRNGAYVAIADLDGDGYGDLITGAGPGGGPRVLAYGGRQYSTGGTIPRLLDFFPGDSSNRGGVDVAGVQADSDGKASLITGPGKGAAPRVQLHKLVNGQPNLQRTLEAFDPSFTGGVYVG